MRPASRCRRTVWPCRPGERGFAGGIHPENGDTAIPTKRRAIQREAADAEISGDENGRIGPRITIRHRDRAIEFDRLGERLLSVILPGRISHQPCVDDQQIAAGIPLQEFDRAPSHVRKCRLLGTGGDLLRESHLAAAKKPEQARTPPARNVLQIGLCPDDFITVTAQLEHEIATIAALTSLALRQEFRARLSDPSPGRDR